MNFKLLAVALFAAVMSCGCASPTAPTAVAPSLVSISILGSRVQRVRLGETLQLTAMGRYSDESTKDVTMQVTWVSSIPGVLIITKGAVFARAIGSSRVFITITMPDLLSDSIMIEVVPAGSGFFQALFYY